MPRLTLLFATLVLLPLFISAQANQPSWELRVCADPANMPFSSIDGNGFNNRIASMIAAELGAELSYEWVPFTDISTVRQHYLMTGKCDLMFGLDDGAPGFLHSLTYFRSPYVFVQHKASLQRVETLDDLTGQEIAVQDSGTPPHVALVNRGLTGNIAVIDVYGHYGNEDWQAQIVNVVTRGEVDVALAWGPAAGYFAANNELTVSPIRPEIEPPFLIMVRSITIGFRPGDHSLRDRVDLALAERWDEISALLREYHVPLANNPDPRATMQPIREQQLRIGVILPVATDQGSAAELYPAALSARQAAELAGAKAALQAQATDQEVIMYFAVAPDTTAAERAVNRLISTEGIHGIVGGLGEGHTDVLAKAAMQTDIPFMNIGDTRSTNENTFNIAPSPDQYLRAIRSVYPAPEKWLVISEDSQAGAEQAAMASHYFPGTYEMVAGDTRIFTRQFELLRNEHYDAVLVLLSRNRQLEFMTQLGLAHPNIHAVGLPDHVTQTRTAYEYLRETVPELAHGLRIALWDASLPSSVNEEYSARFGIPLEPAGWATYAAVTILNDAFLAANSQDLTARLMNGPAWEAGKSELEYDPCSGQLFQELYVVQLAETVAGRGSPERLRLGHRTDMAEVIDVIAPEEAPNNCQVRLGPNKPGHTTSEV